VTYKTAQFERMFDKLQVEAKPSNHHRSGFIIDEGGGKLFPPLYFSKGNKEVGPRISGQIRKALFLDEREFDTLVRCRMSRLEYLTTRRSKTF
jgi:hypothetical protein